MDLVIPELKELDDDLLELTGFDKDLLIEEDEKDDEIPETPKEPQTKLGDIYILGGKHRVMCGDSTKIEDIEKLMDGKKADVGFNDPPYGMKKEKQGVMNDNLNYNDLLDFNRQWIPLQFGYLKDNGSFYCWGIDEPLMDIYSEIIKPYIKTQKATFRNLITWNKSYLKNGNTFNPFGASGSDGLRSYPTADEKCLFVMLGVQGFNNNADNYFEGWEPIRKYLNDEMDKCGGRSKWKEALGNQMGSHYFTKSQWTLPTEENYKKLQEYANGDAFKKEYDAFKKEYDELKKEYDELKKEYYSTRAYFDNADESNNIWNIEITRGDDKVKAEGHATPKPLELCERAIKSSCPENGLTIDFFLGSGSTLIACEKTNRICYGAELDPRYVDVIVQRYCDYVGDYKIIKNNQEIQWQK
jgi:DNA modification methylase